MTGRSTASGEPQLDTSCAQPEVNEPIDGRSAEDIELEQLFRDHRSSGDVELRNALATRYLSLAAAVARRFANRGEPLDDLVQVANYGLVKAVERFDVDRGVSFASFAIPTMIGELKRHFRDRTWSTKVPRSAKDLMPRLSTATEELTTRLQRAPTVPELAEHLGVDVDALLEAIDARAAYRASSMSSSGQRGDSDLEMQVGDLDPDLVGVENTLTVRHLIETLPDRERRIVELRFYDELTQSEIAEIVGVSQMHVSRLLRQALDRLATRARGEMRAAGS